MSRLTLDCRNMLVQTPEFQARLADKTIGRGQAFNDGWCFDSYPYANIEKKSHQALVVITDAGTWQEPNAHNSQRFPRINVDIWASPTRMPDGSPKTNDADFLIEDIAKEFMRYLHTVNLDVPGDQDEPVLPYLGKPGQPRMWGTATQIEARTGSFVFGSQSLDQPIFSDVRDGNGARMGRYSFGISTLL